MTEGFGHCCRAFFVSTRQVDEEEKLLVQRHEDGSELRWHILRMVRALCGDGVSRKGAVNGLGDPKGEFC